MIFIYNLEAISKERLLDDRLEKKIDPKEDEFIEKVDNEIFYSMV